MQALKVIFSWVMVGFLACPVLAGSADIPDAVGDLERYMVRVLTFQDQRIINIGAGLLLPNGRVLVNRALMQNAQRAQFIHYTLVSQAKYLDSAHLETNVLNYETDITSAGLPRKSEGQARLNEAVYIVTDQTIEKAFLKRMFTTKAGTFYRLQLASPNMTVNSGLVADRYGSAFAFVVFPRVTSENCYAVSLFELTRMTPVRQSGIGIFEPESDSLKRIADAWYAEGLYLDALPFYQRLQAAVPSDNAIQRRIAEALFKTRQYTQSIKEWQQLLEKSNAKSDILAQIGQCYFQTEAYELAIVTYTRGIAEEQDNAQLYTWRADAYMKTGKPAAAIADYKTSLGINNQNPSAFYGLGLAYEAVKKWDKARAAFLKTLVLDPANGPAQTELDSVTRALNPAAPAAPQVPENLIPRDLAVTGQMKYSAWLGATADYPGIMSNGLKAFNGIEIVLDNRNLDTMDRFGFNLAVRTHRDMMGASVGVMLGKGVMGNDWLVPYVTGYVFGGMKIKSPRYMGLGIGFVPGVMLMDFSWCRLDMVMVLPALQFAGSLSPSTLPGDGEALLAYRFSWKI